MVPELVLIATLMVGDFGFFSFKAPEGEAIIVSGSEGIDGVEALDRIPPGTVLSLSANQTVELLYPNSCHVETITGGRIETGTVQTDGRTRESTVEGGDIKKVYVDCDPVGRARSYIDPSTFLANPPNPTKIKSVTTHLTFVSAPLILLSEDAETVKIEKLNQASFYKPQSPLAPTGATLEFKAHGGMVDLQAEGVTLELSTPYLISTGQFGAVLRVSRLAGYSQDHSASRIVDFRPLFETDAWQWVPPERERAAAAAGTSPTDKKSKAVIKRTDRNTFDR